MKLLVLFIALVAARTFPRKDGRRVLLEYGQVLDGAQSVPPNPVEGAGGGHVYFDTETFTVSWIIGVGGLTGPATAAHFHGPANRTENAGVQVDIGAISGLSNTMIGAAVLNPDQAQMLLQGMLYLNVHTAQYPAGEIRGQLVDSNFLNYGQELSALQSVPPTLSQGHGISHVTLDPASSTLSWFIGWDDLTGPATLAHFHGDAPIGVNSDVQVDIGALGGLTSPNIGATVLNPSQVAGLISGNWYINVHTEANPAGEIRGQVRSTTSLLFSSLLNGNNQVPPVQTNATGAIHGFMDTLTGGVSWILVHDNLEAPTLAHFHGPAPPGVNAGVRVDVAAQSVAGTQSPMSGITETTPEFVQEFLEGLMYVNVHTSTNPGGEIRGQMIRNAKLN